MNIHRFANVSAMYNITSHYITSHHIRLGLLYYSLIKEVFMREEKRTYTTICTVHDMTWHDINVYRFASHPAICDITSHHITSVRRFHLYIGPVLFSSDWEERNKQYIFHRKWAWETHLSIYLSIYLSGSKVRGVLFCSVLFCDGLIPRLT
jgi:hypothetical protein